MLIANNDADENPFTIALTGFGIAPSNTLSATSRSVSFVAGSDSITLTVTPEIASWTATPNAAWLHLSAANQSGTGSTNITFTFDANPGAQRVGTLTIGGQTLTVTQAALPYAASLGTTNLVESSSAGSDSVVLLLIPAANSNWTATANNPWLHLTAANQSGNSSTNVIFTFDVNTGATRIGTLTIAGQTLFVTQAGSNYLTGGAVTTLAGSGLNAPSGIAVDSAGNIYFADTANNAIKKWTKTNNLVTAVVASGLNQPSSVAVDRFGNLYIADTSNQAIKKWTATNNTVTTIISSGLSLPTGVAVDIAGNLYIADAFSQAIKKWTATNNTVTTLLTGLDLPYAVAVDLAGNIYIAYTFNDSVKMWNPATLILSTLISTGIKQPYSVAVDISGNVYVADAQNNAIKKWTATLNTVSTLASGLNLPKGVAVDANGNVYFADTSNNQIKALPRAFVDVTARSVNTPASTNTFSPVLPLEANLLPPFAPTSSQAWLTLINTSNATINFAVTASGVASRTVNLTVLNRAIAITQTLSATPPQLSYAKLPTGLAVSFAANPTQLYQIESAPAVTGPWITNTTLTGNISGFLSYTNSISTVSNRFFRTRTP